MSKNNFEVFAYIRSVREKHTNIEFAAASGHPIDLIDLRNTGEPLMGEILRDGIHLKDSNSAHAQTVSRHLFDSAD